MQQVIVPPNNLGIPRSEMPQIQSTRVPEFLDFLRHQGVRIDRGSARVGELRGTQRDINPEKVMQMAKGSLGANLAKPVIVSQDNYLLDGHHRWAALYNLDPNNTIPTIRVGLPIKDLLSQARNFGGTTYKGFDERLTEGHVPKSLVLGFLEHLRGLGIKVTPGQMAAGRIQPTKDLEHLQWDRIERIARNFSPAQITRWPLLVTEDGFLFDGHHRWAALHEIDSTAPAPVLILGAPFATLLPIERAYEQAARSVQVQQQPDSIALEQLVQRVAQGTTADEVIASLLGESQATCVIAEDNIQCLRREALIWMPSAEHEMREIFHKAGLRTRVLELAIECFDFIQGALKNDETRHARVQEAILGEQALPPLIATPAHSEGRWTTLDGHHRILATVQTLWPPYPKMRTIEVTYPNGGRFTWKDGELGERLKKSIPGYHTTSRFPT